MEMRPLPEGNFQVSRSTFLSVLSFGVVHVMSIFESHSQILVQVNRESSHMEIDEIVFPRDHDFHLSINFFCFGF